MSADANVEAVRELLLRRSIVGIAKYGTTTERGDIDELGMLRHALEEACDLAVYLQAAIVRITALHAQLAEVKAGEDAAGAEVYETAQIIGAAIVGEKPHKDSMHIGHLPSMAKDLVKMLETVTAERDLALDELQCEPTDGTSNTENIG